MASDHRLPHRALRTAAVALRSMLVLLASRPVLSGQCKAPPSPYLPRFVCRKAPQH